LEPTVRGHSHETVWLRTSEWGDRRSRDVTQTMYTHVSKYKNDKIKERKKNFQII
jgi:hypothetical protein